MAEDEDEIGSGSGDVDGDGDGKPKGGREAKIYREEVETHSFNFYRLPKQTIANRFRKVKETKRRERGGEGMGFLWQVKACQRHCLEFSIL